MLFRSQNMADKNEIANAFDALAERYNEDKSRLSEIIPGIKEKAFEAGSLMKKYLEDN